MADVLRTRRLWIGWAAAGSIVAAAAFAIRRRRVSNRIHNYASQLQARSHPVSPYPYDPGDVSDLPPPVRRYFETVLNAGQPYVEQVSLDQEGEFRLGDGKTRWRPFTASQTYTVSPPGYIWDAQIDVFPAASVRVFDAYVGGEGLLRANLYGGIPLASAGPDSRMNAAELQRYLSETPWFPTALLPAAGVTWEGIDDRSARATIDDGNVTATARFHFDEEGYVRRLTADRYRQDIDAVTSWTGHYRTYKEYDGMQIPTEAEVAWDTPEGEEPYWRGTITDIEYKTG